MVIERVVTSISYIVELLAAHVLVRHVPSDPDESVSEHVKIMEDINRWLYLAAAKVIQGNGWLVKQPVMPDFPIVYRFIGGIFDPNEANHLQNIKMMDPVDVETILDEMHGVLVWLGETRFVEIISAVYRAHVEHLGLKE
ncbi:hypothetical protein M8C21_026607 [Ambrosia artemisiifolia]|uniref:Uncharacterized protein n=1 Tax=Ambrosia artemisiifolia TaxID=4212 RepID=A0AAD5GJZ6_AMBAR|nr:hypothetical protein M8C21_026607 [Ambrosia artemisiifolia]